MQNNDSQRHPDSHWADIDIFHIQNGMESKSIWTKFGLTVPSHVECPVVEWLQSNQQGWSITCRLYFIFMVVLSVNILERNQTWLPPVVSRPFFSMAGEKQWRGLRRGAHGGLRSLSSAFVFVRRSMLRSQQSLPSDLPPQTTPFRYPRNPSYR